MDCEESMSRIVGAAWGKILCALGKHKMPSYDAGVIFSSGAGDHPRAWVGLCARCDKLFVKRLTDADAERIREEAIRGL